MKKSVLVKFLLSCLLCLLVLEAGCCLDIGCFDIKSNCCPNIGNDSLPEYGRTDIFRSNLDCDSTVIVKTECGNINITGKDVNDCSITAKISVKAPTVEEAKQIIEKVEVKLIYVDKTLDIKVNKPRLSKNHFVGVSFDITVPRQTHFSCSSSFGSIKMVDICGNIKGKTDFAPIECKDVKGIIDLNTSYGNIICQNIIPDELTVKSCFGGIEIFCSPLTPSETNIDLLTSYGNIELVAPAEFAGGVNLEARYGLIETGLPIVTKQAPNKQKIKGMVGQGQGKLNLKTCFGLVKVK